MAWTSILTSFSSLSLMWPILKIGRSFPWRHGQTGAALGPWPVWRGGKLLKLMKSTDRTNRANDQGQSRQKPRIQNAIPMAWTLILTSFSSLCLIWPILKICRSFPWPHGQTGAALGPVALGPSGRGKAPKFNEIDRPSVLRSFAVIFLQRDALPEPNLTGLALT